MSNQVGNQWSKKFGAALSKGTAVKVQSAQSEPPDLTLGHILLRLKTAKKAQDDKIAVNLLV